jgi:hypothetical protein
MATDKNKKEVKVRDLKPSKDAKGGVGKHQQDKGRGGFQQDKGRGGFQQDAGRRGLA